MLFMTTLISRTINVCSSVLGLVLNAICSNNLLGSSIYSVEELSRAFRYCYSFRISPLLYKSSIKLLASVKVSVWPDSFYPNKNANLVLLSIMLDAMNF